MQPETRSTSGDIEIRATDGTFAAEVVGVDLSRPLEAELFLQIENAFNERGVIFFRGQSLSPEALIRFSRRFGDVERHVRQEYALPGFPEIHVLSNIKEGDRTIGSAYAGDMWHADLCFTKRPSRCSILHALEIPMKNGKALGDTLFVNTGDAYDRVPDDMKKRLAMLRGVQQYNRRQEIKRLQLAHDHPRPLLTKEQLAQTPDITQPVIRTHPITGRKCLYVNETYTFGIEGMDEAEAAPLLRELHAHCTRPEGIYRHRWQVGDVLMWDNCSTQHKAIGDYALPQRRKMIRTSVSGTEVF